MSSNVFKVAPFVVAILVMGIAGYVQGKWSERWGTFPELQIFAKQLDAIPMQVGEWQGKDGAKSDDKIMKVAGAEGEFVRSYTNGSGQQVQVSIICARLRDVFYHTPDRCYPAAGFEMQGEPQPVVFDIGDMACEFFTTSFNKSEPTGSHNERGYWSWSADGKWIAPKDPKLKFAGQRALYKLYVFAAIPPGKTRGGDEFCADFIRQFMPALDQALRPAFDKAAGIEPTTAEPVLPIDTPVAPAAAPAGEAKPAAEAKLDKTASGEP